MAKAQASDRQTLSEERLADLRKHYNTGEVAELLAHIDAQAKQLKKAAEERNIFRDDLVGSEAELAAAEKRIAALEAIIAKLPKRADGAQGYGLNKDQQKAIADLWAWQEQSLRSDIVLGGPIAKANPDEKGE